MQKSFILASLIALSGWGCAGIAFATHGTPIGFIYADAQSNERVTDNGLATKIGEACAMSVLGWVTVGDASVATAAKAGSVTKIAAVDHSIFNVLGVYSKYCVVVTGE